MRDRYGRQTTSKLEARFLDALSTSSDCARLSFETDVATLVSYKRLTLLLLVDVLI